jgi:hypothetical protein
VTEYLGWIATAVFALSYFSRRPRTLRYIQMAGAFMWVVYGFLIGAVPVVAANLLVVAAAAWTNIGLGNNSVTPTDERTPAH